MNKIIFLGIVFFVGLNSFGQTYDSAAVIFSNTITADDLSKHLHVLASDEYEGRETGKNGQKMAMKYLINQFKSFGIKAYDGESFTQEFKLIEQKNTGISIKLGEKKYEVNKDFSFSPRIYHNKQIKTELIFVGYGVASNYKKVDVKGKAVFILENLPKKYRARKEYSLKARIQIAKSLGAEAVFVYKKEYKEILEKNKHYFTKPKMKLVEDINENEIAVMKVTREFTLEYIKGQKVNLDKVDKKGLKKLNSFSKEIEIDINRPSLDLISENVLAFIPGTSKKEEVVVLTAHYDHIGMEDTIVFNGADDDGTGTVTLIEIAEAFMIAQKQGYKNKRSILIMAVSGEEKGLLGSKYYTNHPVFPLENTVTNLNIDMIGRYDIAHENDSNYVYLIGSDKLSNDLHIVSEKVNELYINTTLDYTFNAENDPNRFYYRSDHYNFAKKDVPVIFYFSGVHKDYHKATDTVEKIDFRKTQKIARLVFLTAWELANREKRVELNVK